MTTNFADDSKKILKFWFVKKLILVIAYFSSWIGARPQPAPSPDTIIYNSGNLRLKGLLWKPAGKGPFPAILFAHGSYSGSDTIHSAVKDVSLLGPTFAKNGMIFFVPFRRGLGLSAGEGINSADLMDQALAREGAEGRNRVQIHELETTQMRDMLAGLEALINRPEVDTSRLGVVGHSFGGSLGLLFAEQVSYLKAVVIFSAGGYSWNLSLPLRQRLIRAAHAITIPVMIIHAQNDYSVNPGLAMDSARKQAHKPVVLFIYPPFGNNADQGHNIIFLGIGIWQTDVFEFLHKAFK
jgi:dipeptidyl aminopeptidase/acylaminoacyl peptidase